MHKKLKIQINKLNNYNQMCNRIRLLIKNQSMMKFNTDINMIKQFMRNE